MKFRLDSQSYNFLIANGLSTITAWEGRQLPFESVGIGICWDIQTLPCIGEVRSYLQSVPTNMTQSYHFFLPWFLRIALEVHLWHCVYLWILVPYFWTGLPCLFSSTCFGHGANPCAICAGCKLNIWDHCFEWSKSDLDLTVHIERRKHALTISAEEMKQLPFLVGVLDLFTSFLVSIVNFYGVCESHLGPWHAFIAQGCW